jgi:tricarballylate dehydrogenase
LNAVIHTGERSSLGGPVDVIVVGGDNAGLCAALAARAAGAEVCLLERAPFGEHGGNSAFTAGAMRVAYNGIEDLLELMRELSVAETTGTEFGSYPQTAFYDDLGRVTEYRTNPELANLLVSDSLDTLVWMRSHGVRFIPIYGRQAYRIDGKYTFWGGLTVEVSGGGTGLIAGLTNAAEQQGVRLNYSSRVLGPLHDGTRVSGVRINHDGLVAELHSKAVVLASGGFEANPEWRAIYLGPGWDLAKVRGTQFNTGDGIQMALDVGASPAGHWSGCHAVCWDRNAPEFGDRIVRDEFQKHSYPLGIMVNALGARFVDEGADFRNYTYAKYGSRVLEQPGQIAWQVFDARVSDLLRDEYRIRAVTKASAGSLDELATRMDGIDRAGFLTTVDRFNASVKTDVEFNPNIRDGRGTRGLELPKSNWANPLDTPPFEAYTSTRGVTFTFGGLRVTTDAQVVSTDAGPIPGLYACGELVGELFYFNYPGGSGLTSGAVFGRLAGRKAAEASLVGASAGSA